MILVIAARISLIIKECLASQNKTFAVNRSVNNAELVEINYAELISRANTTKWDNFITKWEKHYKVGQLL